MLHGTILFSFFNHLRSLRVHLYNATENHQFYEKFPLPSKVFFPYYSHRNLLYVELQKTQPIFAFMQEKAAVINIKFIVVHNLIFIILTFPIKNRLYKRATLKVRRCFTIKKKSFKGIINTISFYIWWKNSPAYNS